MRYLDTTLFVWVFMGIHGFGFGFGVGDGEGGGGGGRCGRRRICGDGWVQV
jgi:hypothetical protein